MAYSTAVIGFGSSVLKASTTLSGGVYTPGSYTKIAQSIDIESAKPEVGDVKITNNDSPNNSQEYSPAGLIEPGELEFEWLFTAASFNSEYGTLGDGNVYSFKELYADGSYMTVLGWYKSLQIMTKTENEANKVKVVVKCKSKMTFAVS